MPLHTRFGAATSSALLRRARLLIVLALISGCTALPTPQGRSNSQFIDDTLATRLGSASRPPPHAQPGHSGVLALAEGHEAFATRMLLAEAAERSLDVQYYIWHADLTGSFLMQALHRAAERGVRVRLLLDDNNTSGMDDILAALDSHPNVEVRLFNPFFQRRWRWLGYLTDFARLNRRMHNKSFTADNQVTIVGGRNIGDEYFDAGQETSFIDLDVLAVGAVVPQVSADFDRYWACASAFPVASLFPLADARALERMSAKADTLSENPAAAPYREALERSAFIKRLLTGELELEWTKVKLVSDDPAKGLGIAAEHAMLPQRLLDVLGGPQEDLLLVSPYFVPATSGTQALVDLSARGVKVSVLTNSLAATDVPAVHAGYAKRRYALLDGGVRLFELKPDAHPARSARADHGLAGSSGASLHAKTFAVDGQRVFIGSFNLDPRSAALNTESGFVIDSPRLANEIRHAFQETLATQTYTLHLDAEGRIEWQDKQPGNAPPQVHQVEPQTSIWTRALVRVLSWLPIEWML